MEGTSRDQLELHPAQSRINYSSLLETPFRFRYRFSVSTGMENPVVVLDLSLVNKIFLMFKWNVLNFSLSPLLLIFSLDHREEFPSTFFTSHTRNLCTWLGSPGPLLPSPALSSLELTGPIKPNSTEWQTFIWARAHLVSLPWLTFRTVDISSHNST